MQQSNPQEREETKEPRFDDRQIRRMEEREERKTKQALI